MSDTSKICQCKIDCILDCNAIFHLSAIQLGGISLIDRILRDFNVIIPEFIIKEEFQRKIYTYKFRKDYTSSQLKRIEAFINKHALYTEFSENDYSGCFKYFDHWIDNPTRGTPEPGFYHWRTKEEIHEGEIHCASLVLHKNREKNRFNILISDDFNALQGGMENFVWSQKTGFCWTSFDVILFYFMKDPKIIWHHVNTAFRDLFNIMNLVENKQRKSLYQCTLNESYRVTKVGENLCKACI